MRKMGISLCFISQQPQLQLRPNFVYKWFMTRLSFLIIKPKSCDVTFIMQIRAKCQILSSVNLKVKTFKSDSVMGDSWSYPRTLSKCADMNFVKQSHSAHSLSLVVFSSVYRWWRITYLVKVTRSNLVRWYAIGRITYCVCQNLYLLLFFVKFLSKPHV